MEKSSTKQRTKKPKFELFASWILTIVFIVVSVCAVTIAIYCIYTYQQRISMSQLVTVSGDAYTDIKCTNRIATGIPPTEKLGTYFWLDGKDGKKFRVVWVIWEVEEGKYQDWYFRAP